MFLFFDCLSNYFAALAESAGAAVVSAGAEVESAGAEVESAAVVSAVLVYLNKEKFSLISTGAALVITFIDYFKINGRSVIKAYREYGSVHYVAPWVVLVGVIIAAAPIVIDILEEKGIIKKK